MMSDLGSRAMPSQKVAASLLATRVGREKAWAMRIKEWGYPLSNCSTPHNDRGSVSEGRSECSRERSLRSARQVLQPVLPTSFGSHPSPPRSHDGIVECEVWVKTHARAVGVHLSSCSTRRSGLRAQRAETWRAGRYRLVLEMPPGARRGRVSVQAHLTAGKQSASITRTVKV